jgi:hypothetical protein
MDTQFYNTYIYFIFAENAFYPIGGGKGSPDFERRLERIKRYLEKKGYKITQNDLEVRKDIITVWNCPDEDKQKSFVDAIFRLLKKLDRVVATSQDAHRLRQAYRPFTFGCACLRQFSNKQQKISTDPVLVRKKTLL